MLVIFKQMGVWGPLLLIVAIVNLVLVIRSALRSRTAGADTGVDAILFWGVVSALMGFLGQYSGLYKALTAIGGAQQISPSLVAQGFAESFSTTLFGMTVLLLSAIAWWTLRWRSRRKVG